MGISDHNIEIEDATITEIVSICTSNRPEHQEQSQDPVHCLSSMWFTIVGMSAPCTKLDPDKYSF